MTTLRVKRKGEMPNLLARNRPICKLLALAGLICAVLLAGPSQRARAATPENPEIKQMVDRAVKWLETQDDERLGGKCLIGLACFKAGKRLSHPKVQAAQRACESRLPTPGDQHYNYSLGLAVVFLLETDPSRNRSLAQRFVSEIVKNQQAGGGWGYVPTTNDGDTSQTQYPTLGLWLAATNGFDVPQ